MKRKRQRKQSEGVVAGLGVLQGRDQPREQHDLAETRQGSPRYYHYFDVFYLYDSTVIIIIIISYYYYH